MIGLALVWASLGAVVEHIIHPAPLVWLCASVVAVILVWLDA